MANLVPGAEIEGIVGVQRHQSIHYGRAVSAEQSVYILHSQDCLDSGIDLRECRFSEALDRGIYGPPWADSVDVPVALEIRGGLLVPLRDVEVS